MDITELLKVCRNNAIPNDTLLEVLEEIRYVMIDNNINESGICSIIDIIDNLEGKYGYNE